MWEGRSEEQTVIWPNSFSSSNYFLIFLDKFWPYDRLILLNNIVCDANRGLFIAYLFLPILNIMWKETASSLAARSRPGCSGCATGCNIRYTCLDTRPSTTVLGRTRGGKNWGRISPQFFWARNSTSTQSFTLEIEPTWRILLPGLK
jgi:hypothetical protein